MAISLKNKIEKKLTGVKPAHVMLAVCVYLLLTWVLSYLVDVRNLFGLRDALRIKDYLMLQGERVPLWWLFFREAGLTEILQWAALLSTAIGGSFLYRKLNGTGGKGRAFFWRLISLAAVLMLLEDALNVRHLMNRLILALAGLDWSSTAGRSLRTVLELTYFAVLGAIPLYAMLRYGKYVVTKSLPTCFYLLFGYIFYGLAVFFSGTRYINEWYYSAGTRIYEFMKLHASGELLYVSTDTLSMEFWLMDCVIEESLELIGAGALLAAVLAYGRHIKWDKGSDQH